MQCASNDANASSGILPAAVTIQKWFGTDAAPDGTNNTNSSAVASSTTINPAMFANGTSSASLAWDTARTAPTSDDGACRTTVPSAAPAGTRDLPTDHTSAFPF